MRQRIPLQRRRPSLGRDEFIIAIGLVLFGAFMAGWAIGWLVHRLTHGRTADLGELDRLAGQLQDAETERDEAVAYLRARETELLRELSQARAETKAAMEGLRDARAEVEELRTLIEEVAGAV